ncbi:PRC-barrel domain-containing protein [Oceaniglobus indicus]|uniref:PRC-barrel domain-containing protein n=1 Tax=Oceaniglobus indicus TaxID=2047749 RepID=UPI000C17CEB9|nr:PRC-barrel domain-containing protein [Oceaniglobus indicus]
MMNRNRTRNLLLGTALTLPLGGVAFAQEIVIDESQLAGKSTECVALAEAAEGVDASALTVSADDVVMAINEDDVERCVTLRREVMVVETDRTEREEVTEEVELSQDATIEGQARVTVPEPNVDVQVPAPNVRVTSQQPQVTVSQEPAQIELEQAQPTISVEIPEIIVRVDIPAPKVYVLNSEMQVSVSADDPQVEVEQGEPRVSVTQADPELAIDLDVDADAEGTDQAMARETDDDGVKSVDGDVAIADDQPVVEYVQAEGEPVVDLRTSDPTVSFDSVEPNVTVMMAERPTIEVNQSGEPSVTIETVEEREQRRQRRAEEAERMQANAPAAEEAPRTTAEAPQTEGVLTTEEVATDEVATDEVATDQVENESIVGDQAATSTAGNGMTMTVADLRNMDVVTADGEDLGSPSAFIRINGEPHVVLASGGFLGIGEKEVPVAMSRVTVQNDQLILDAMTEQDIEAANDFEFDRNVVLDDEEQITLIGN